MVQALEKKKKARTVREVPKEEIEMAAYYHWLKRGCPQGDPLTDWLAAEKEGPAQRSWLKRILSTNRKGEAFEPRDIEHA